jgi:hypothetical protein
MYLGTARPCTLGRIDGGGESEYKRGEEGGVVHTFGSAVSGTGGNGGTTAVGL